MILKIRKATTGWAHYELDSVSFSRATWGVFNDLIADGGVIDMLDPVPKDLEKAGPLILAHIKLREKERNVMFGTIAYLSNNEGRTLEVLNPAVYS